jgi:hypothetical protein
MAKHVSTLKTPTRRQVARRAKEEKLNRILTWSAIGVVAVILLIVGYGLITELVIKARRPVARVDDVAITTQHYQQRLYYERQLMRQQLNFYQVYLLQLDPNDETMQSFYQELQMMVSNLESQLSANMASVLGKQVLDKMMEEELVRTEAQKRNLTVNPDDMALAIEEMLGYDREAAATVTDTTTLQSYDQLYKDFTDNILRPSRFSEQAFRAMVEATLLREQLQEVMSADIAPTSDQLESILFAVDSEETGFALREKIDQGEEPETLVEELNNDDNDQTAGYPLPWMPFSYLSTQLGMELEQVALNTPVGKASAPTLGSDGQYYVIYVSGHEERPVEAAVLQQMRQDKYNEWLNTQKLSRWEYLDWQSAVLTAP